MPPRPDRISFQGLARVPETQSTCRRSTRPVPADPSLAGSQADDTEQFIVAIAETIGSSAEKGRLTAGICPACATPGPGRNGDCGFLRREYHIDMIVSHEAITGCRSGRERRSKFIHFWSYQIAPLSQLDARLPHRCNRLQSSVCGHYQVRKPQKSGEERGGKESA